MHMSNASPKIRMYYDGQCGVCRGGVRRLLRLDWLGALEAIDFNSLSAERRPVDDTTFARGMPLHTRRGRLLVGFPAVRHALIHTPVGWLVGWLLYVPGLSQLGHWGYDAFARRRRRDGRASGCRT